MKYLLFIFIFLCMASCSQNVIIPGTYVRTFEKIELNSDSTFSYKYTAHWPQSAVEGTWTLIGDNQIMLTSTYNLENLPVEVFESTITSENIHFSIEPIGNYTEDLKHNLIYGIEIDGQEIVREHHNRIEIQYFNTFQSFRINIYYISNDLPTIITTRKKLSTVSYEIQSNDANFFAINFPFDYKMFRSETFENEIIILKSNNLYWHNKARPFFKKIK